MRCLKGPQKVVDGLANLLWEDTELKKDEDWRYSFEEKGRDNRRKR